MFTDCNCVYNINLINLDGSNRVNLTKDLGSSAAGSWSRDGKRIFFSSSRARSSSNPDYLYGLFMMNADGSNPVQITGPNFIGGVNPVVSPNGRYILFTHTTDEEHTNIYRMNSDGSGIIQLTREGRFNADPTWSPDGGRISFVSWRDNDGVPQIYIMNADGSNQHEITAGLGGEGPDWSPAP